MWVFRGRPARVVGLLFVLTACGTSSYAKKDEVQELRQELREARERQLLMDRRLADLDARMVLLSERVATKTGAEAGAKVNRPALGVVKVGPAESSRTRRGPQPSEQELTGDADDEVPEIVLDESAEDAPRLAVDREVLMGPADKAKGLHKRPEVLAAQQEEVLARTDPKTQYELAMRHFKAKQFAAAARGFEEVADRWSDHSLADNALYWTGVCYLEEGENALAINELQKVPVRYPRSDKVPDALFKLAEAYLRVGDKESAKAMLTQVVEIYPHAEAAGRAREGLARLNKP